ncbi:hypothetical protein COV20_01550 [Candidatus Woesearchaeota archaeon CG10_big_fil_rev_8_21_14_0_10_45_16]|nr:MAG: hypothetical protein COV20_01550 [Candidatus Woesearchaeota archaeon CG10_big_fil_rev_8_21_14_0_10_45_16]
MDIRNVQKTGDMFYLYLPTRWCKKFNISGKSKVGVQVNKDGSLAIYPQAKTEKPVHLSLKTNGEMAQSLHKLIIASYISPANSFKITVDKELDYATILNQKNLVSLELVEIDGKHITCESSIKVADPSALLVTMIRKVRNLLLVMSKGAPQELIDRYESEIDRSKLLIERSVIASFVNPAESQNTTVELHFTSLISKELERLVDHVIALKKPTAVFLKTIGKILADLQDLLQDSFKNLDPERAVAFCNQVDGQQGIEVKSIETYDLRRSVRALNAISEVVIDWAVIRQMER